ncbi:uncharacterized protein V1510DRAFT_402251 [Dipodascopsis tothii]|uniref:uncharacterized protein n=1 Tax=Dipodascopsis tothii TaxID=44089 RepID=UPI0034CD4014
MSGNRFFLTTVPPLLAVAGGVYSGYAFFMPLIEEQQAAAAAEAAAKSDKADASDAPAPAPAPVPPEAKSAK